MSDCKHEPIEIQLGMVGSKGERYMQPLVFSELQPRVPQPTHVGSAHRERLLGDARHGYPQWPGPLYALMGCRHCKAAYIDVVPAVRCIDPNPDPFRSGG